MLGVLATQLDRGQTVFAAPTPVDTPDSKDFEVAKRSARRSRNRPSGPWVRVTTACLTNAGKHPNNRQISFSGLTSGKKHTPVWVEIECEGRPYTLTIGDTTSCWCSHQVSTTEDFDALYDLLSKTPDQCVQVELVENRPPASEDIAESNGV